MTTINFYILSAQKKLIPFVCKLTQTVLQKSNDGLLILAPTALIEPLDDMLWSFESTAFIPHGIITAEQSATFAKTRFNPLQAILTNQPQLTDDFTGLVMNLTNEPLLSLIEKHTISKLLEIIAHDELSVLHGRQKFRTYRDMPISPAIQTFHIT